MSLWVPLVRSDAIYMYTAAVPPLTENVNGFSSNHYVVADERAFATERPLFTT